jgi:hypothetical protein
METLKLIEVCLALANMIIKLLVLSLMMEENVSVDHPKV